MAEKRLTSADVVELLSQRTGLAAEQIKAVLQAQAELAYANADKGYPVPGIGRLKMVERPQRTMVMRFCPKQGQEVNVPASRRVQLNLSGLARAMILGNQNVMPDLFNPVSLGVFKFSTDASEMADPSAFLAGLGTPFTLAGDGSPASVFVYRLPDLRLPTGRVVAADGILGGGEPFSRSVSPGHYPLALTIAQLGTDTRVGLAILRFTDERIVKWERGVPEGQQAFDPEKIGYGVDSGTGSFCDASVQQLVIEANEADIGFDEQVLDELKRTYKTTRNWVHIDSPNGSLAIFSSGFGDGFYTSYFGLNEAGSAVVLVTDFGLLNWGPVVGK